MLQDSFSNISRVTNVILLIFFTFQNIHVIHIFEPMSDPALAGLP